VEGQLELTLGAYDAFTAEPLPAMDERFARLGRANVPLKDITIRVRSP